MAAVSQTAAIRSTQSDRQLRPITCPWRAEAGPAHRPPFLHPAFQPPHSIRVSPPLLLQPLLPLRAARLPCGGVDSPDRVLQLLTQGFISIAVTRRSGDKADLSALFLDGRARKDGGRRWGTDDAEGAAADLGLAGTRVAWGGLVGGAGVAVAAVQSIATGFDLRHGRGRWEWRPKDGTAARHLEQWRDAPGGRHAALLVPPQQGGKCNTDEEGKDHRKGVVLHPFGVVVRGCRAV